MKYKNLIALTLVFLFYNSIAQNKPVETEKIILNNTVYITGESLLYKVFVLSESNTLSDASKIGYACLINANHKIVFKQKIGLHNGMGKGDFILSSNLETGHYKFTFFTNQSLQKSTVQSGIKDVYIINPLQNTKQLVKDADTIQLRKNTLFKVETPLSFNKRSKITFTLDNLDKGYYVVNAKQVDSLDLNNVHQKDVINSNTKKIIPEYRGELISGKLLDTNNNPVKNKVISLSITGNPNLYKNVTTNDSGQFYFHIYEPYNNGDLILKTFKNNNLYHIVLDKKEVTFKEQLQCRNLVIDQSLKHWLNTKSIYSQIENVYYQSKQDSVISKGVAKAFYIPNHSYVLDDYTRFPTIKETFTEIISSAYERSKNETHTFFVHSNIAEIDLSTKYNALVLIDGVSVNGNVLYDFNPKDVEQINVINEPFFYGPKVFGGLIDVKTFKRNYNPKLNEVIYKAPIKSVIDNKVYYQPNYSLEKQKLKHIPDFRTQLYWNPDYTFDNNTISFYSSDVTGLFELNIKGFSKKGKEVNLTKYFIIE